MSGFPQPVNATKINGVTVSGTPVAGQAPVASSGTAAAWGSVFSTLGEVAVTTTANLTAGLLHKCTVVALTPYTVTLPTPVGITGQIIGVRVDPASAALLTLATTAGNIDGAATRIMWAGESAWVESDGTNWCKIAGKTIPMLCSMRQAAAQSINSGAVTAVTLDTTVIDNTGLMADPTTNKRINIRRAGVYTVQGSASFNTLAAPSLRTLAIIQKTGVTVRQAELDYLTGNFPGVVLGGLISTAITDNLTIQAFQQSGLAVNTGTGTSGSTLDASESPVW